MDSFLTFIEQHIWLKAGLWLAGLVLLSFLVNFLMRAFLLRAARHLLALIKIDKQHHLHHCIRRLANILPALVFSLGLPLVPHMPAALARLSPPYLISLRNFININHKLN